MCHSLVGDIFFFLIKYKVTLTPDYILDLTKYGEKLSNIF